MDFFEYDARSKRIFIDCCPLVELVDLVTKSWGTLESRDHTVYAVFPFGPVAEEVMLHGRSNNVYKSGETGTFTWAARMHFTRSDDGKVLIDKYTIIVVSTDEPLAILPYQPRLLS